MSRAEQSRAEQSRAEQSRAEQSRAEQSRAEQSRAEGVGHSKGVGENSPRSIWSLVAYLCAIAAGFYLISQIATHSDQYQWDFRIYYFAGQASSIDRDPYNPDVLSAISGGWKNLRFVYPPQTLVLFKSLGRLPYETAYLVWLVLKVIALAILILLWRLTLFREEPPLTFAVFLSLGFAGTIYSDLFAGNVSIFEQALLWGGIALLLRGRQLWFCALVVGASFFKLTPIVFLLLLPLVGLKYAWRYFGISLATFAVLLGLGEFLWPDQSARFWEVAFSISERGSLANPSLYAFVCDLVEMLGGGDGSNLRYLSAAIYALIAGLVCVVSITAWRTAKSNRPAGSQNGAALWSICLFAATFAVTMPRFKSYSFIVLLPPALYAIRRMGQHQKFWPLIALISLLPLTPSPVPLPTRTPTLLFWLYYQLFLAVIVWWLLVTMKGTQTMPDDPGFGKA